MTLKLYSKKRNFEHTPEPGPRNPGSKTKRRKTHPLKFVIQKHAARHLHYDFRLELEGTLKSWAVPKGPSVNPTDSRLAMHVEDHPLEYATFEGVIPAGNYGAGKVIVWDRGTWVPGKPALEAYKEGKLHFELKGKKLKGSWTLFRIRSENDKHDVWLLKKLKDKYAKPNGTTFLERNSRSVSSGKRIEDIE